MLFIYSHHCLASTAVPRLEQQIGDYSTCFFGFTPYPLNFQNGYRRGVMGTIFLSTACIDFVILSINVFRRSTNTASLSTMPSDTQVHDSPMQGWKVMVMETTSLVLEALRTSAVSLWGTLSNQCSSRTSALMRIR